MAYTSPLTNPHYIKVWHDACTRSVKQNPHSQADLYLQLGLNELLNLYGQTKVASNNSLERRNAVYQSFKEAGKTGNARGLFFEGLALQGFGCAPDIITSQALLRVSAFARNCDLALQFLILRMGQGYLYQQSNYSAAMQCFKKAGDIAAIEVRKVADHVSQMRAKLAATQKQALALEPAPRIVNVGGLRASI